MPNLTRIKFSNSLDEDRGVDEDDEEDDVIWVALAKACPNLKFYHIETNSKHLPSKVFQEIVTQSTKLEEFRFLRKMILSRELHLVEGSVVHFMTKNLTSLRFMDVWGWLLHEEPLREFVKSSSNLLAVRCNGTLFIKSGIATKEVADFFQYSAANFKHADVAVEAC